MIFHCFYTASNSGELSVRIRLVLAFMILSGVTLFAQPKVVTLKVGTTVSYVGGFIDLNHIYVSLADISQSLGLHTLTLQSTGKLNIYSEYGSLLFTPENNFVIVSTSSQSKIYQLPLPVLSANGGLYMPADYVGDYFSRIVRGTFAYDEQEAEIDFSVFPSGNVSPVITDVQAQEKANGAVIEIGMQALPRAYELAMDTTASGGKASMLYVTLMPATGKIRELNSLPPTGVYSSLLAIQNPNSVELCFKLKQNYISHQIFLDSSSSSVVVALYAQANIKKILAEETRRKLDEEKKNWKLDVIVIDPGHGGDDPGAIGVTGVEEKDVTLAIAKVLKNYLTEKLPDVKVVMTRDDDEFVELDKRGEIANEAGGKLFISIHCNSMPHKPNPANGLETYFLRPGKTSEAIRIAAQENAAIKYENDYEKRYKSFDADNMILTTMAHGAYVKYSERLAQMMEDNISSVAGVTDDGVSQAGFYVLIGASMPAVLIESGYLSNVREEKYLKSKRGQDAIARGMANAIVEYKSEYEKNFAQD